MREAKANAGIFSTINNAKNVVAPISGPKRILKILKDRAEGAAAPHALGSGGSHAGSGFRASDAPDCVHVCKQPVPAGPHAGLRRVRSSPAPGDDRFIRTDPAVRVQSMIALMRNGHVCSPNSNRNAENLQSIASATPACQTSRERAVPTVRSPRRSARRISPC